VASVTAWIAAVALVTACAQQSDPGACEQLLEHLEKDCAIAVPDAGTDLNCTGEAACLARCLTDISCTEYETQGPAFDDCSEVCGASR
jgi:hypothetical protein